VGPRASYRRLLLMPSGPHHQLMWECCRGAGVCGHSWFQDPVAALSVVGLTNTALEDCMGSFPADVQACIYASLTPD